jgi:hypothetical protein
MRKIALLGLLAFLPVTTLAAPKPPAPATGVRLAAPPPVAAATPTVIDLAKTKLTKDEFDRLPDTQVLELHGQRLTAGALRARMRIVLARRAAGRTSGLGRMETFQAFREKFLTQEKAAIASRNERVLAEFERLKAQHLVAMPR